MRMFWAITLLALAACGRTPPAETAAVRDTAPTLAPPTAAPATAPPARASLTGHHWRLDDARDRDGARIDALFVRDDHPLTLDFAESRVGVSETCNRMGGSYTTEGRTLRVSRMVSTMMACADARLMQLDKEAAARLEGESRFALTDGPTPRLTLTTAAGEVLAFIGQPTAETRYGAPGEQIFLEVGPQTRPCPHPMIDDARCLQVREIRYDAAGVKTASGPWQNFFDPIEGYTHEEGMRNVLRIKRFRRDPVPADASAYAYVLDMVVESEAVSK